MHEVFVQYTILVPNSMLLEQLKAVATVSVSNLCLYTNADIPPVVLCSQNDHKCSRSEKQLKQ